MLAQLFCNNAPIYKFFARHLIESFKDNYSKKYSPKVIEGNVKAMNRGYDEVRGG